MENSQIQNFFAHQTIFITGGTGFVGRVLIEKLLRDCANLKKIYMLMRPKKKLTSQERFRQFFDDICFNRIKSKNLTEKVTFVSGDCMVQSLGLNSKDLRMLIEETTYVIHCAADVRFNQSLKEASHIVRATKYILDIANQMQRLKVFIYVSTLYSNCIYPEIEEKIYEPPISETALFTIVDNFSDDTVQGMTPLLLGDWPNTYVYTKCISESLFKTTKKSFPVAVLRPAIVTNACEEPIPGWINNMYNVMFITTTSVLGILRTCHARNDYCSQMVPVDYVCNCILASAWDTARKDVDTVTVYNYSGLKNRPITHEQLYKLVRKYYWETASVKAVWYSTFTVAENKLWHNICVFSLHTLPAYLIDFILYWMKKPLVAVKMYQTINKGVDALGYFATRKWLYYDDNVEKLWNKMNEIDKKIFNFNMENFDWDSYFRNYFFGIRRYVLNDPDETLPQARRKLIFLKIIHYTVVTLLWSLFFNILYNLFGYLRI